MGDKPFGGSDDDPLVTPAHFMQLIEAQKLEAVGRLAAGIAHEFNNALMAIMGHGALAERLLSEDDPARRHVEKMHKIARRSASLANKFLAFSRRPLVKPHHVDLNAVVTDISELLERMLGTGIRLTLHCSESPILTHCDPGRLEQVLIQLAINARDAMTGDGDLDVHIDTTVAMKDMAADISTPALETTTFARIRVQDSGSGMSDEVRSHLFEPFFTTKEEEQGTGLGLFTCYGIISQYGGRIEVESEVSQGSTFSVLLPLAEADTLQEVHVDPISLDAPTGHETILLVEDEQFVREVLQEVLSTQGYNVIAACHGEEALTLDKELGDTHVHLLLTDVKMPGIDGATLATMLRARRPGLRVLFTSGYVDEPEFLGNERDPLVAFVQKPATPGRLAAEVRALLDLHRDATEPEPFS